MPQFTDGPDSYTVTDPGDYNLSFLGGDDRLTVNGGTTTTASMGEGNDAVILLSGAANVTGDAGADRFDITASGITASGGADNDTFLIRGGDSQTLSGDDGNDRFNLSGNVTNISADLGTGNDSFIGYGYSLTGTIHGGAGADSFVDISGSSNLTIYGGSGDDLYRAWGTNFANIVELPGEGTDTIELARGVSYTMPDNVERLVLGSYTGTTSAAATLTGNASINGITGSGNAETIYGLAGNDRLLGKGGNDIIHGGADNDLVDGGLGNDTLFGDDGNDLLVGRQGDDMMYGGTGNDVYYVDSANDQVIENAGEGTDTVRTTVDYTLGANVERGVVDTSTGLSLIGNELNNRLNGNAGADHLDGGLGNDVIIGGGGNDTIIGGAGADTVAGGIGNDTFVFNNASDSMPGAYDRITDFQSLNTTGYDHIDFSGIDANVNVDGNQEFAGLQYNYETPTANSLWWSSVLNADGTQDVVIYGDTDGNTSTVELELHIHTDHGVNWDQFTL